MIQRSTSRVSSHFCDLDIDDNDNDDGNGSIADLIEESTDLEKQNPGPTPSKVARPRESRLSIILLDQGLFTVYKPLFLVYFTLNIFSLVLATIGQFPYAERKATLFSIGNILSLMLCRSEAFLRVIFWLAVKLFGRPWVPIQLKTSTTSLQSLGGIHSSCSVSSIAWLVFSIVLTLKDRENTSHGLHHPLSSLSFLGCLPMYLKEHTGLPDGQLLASSRPLFSSPSPMTLSPNPTTTYVLQV